eukprot:UC4_evm1s999
MCQLSQGKIDDASCDVDAVEKANDLFLFSLLDELSNTTYFRLFKVDMSRKCRFFGKEVTESTCGGGDEGGDDVPPFSSKSSFTSPFGEEAKQPPTRCSLQT